MYKPNYDDPSPNWKQNEAMEGGTASPLIDMDKPINYTDSKNM
jgi:hypothetical protein